MLSDSAGALENLLTITMFVGFSEMSNERRSLNKEVVDKPSQNSNICIESRVSSQTEEEWQRSLAAERIVKQVLHDCRGEGQTWTERRVR
jgi:hypothetical protein